ncbi:carboxypeptidase-like regulatory domain-containing protein [Solirubrobacter ginsenosidimutans]|uniref:Carboxypeptidase-like regulatory domain-containing protein n=1 Tax=Solirubrobacter ginsenosidimutans TaxID=490573 RepID=A0A9X3N2Y1_9ACTN|nr:carboxypeptidase-like regulatory domain-containing protein [Solirubrobacter ginsenosidimutans]MDA0166070.1 carboxypeptidase-like regulatory domain-containing protein [Solirubrobacter ginsenosidimutans]
MLIKRLCIQVIATLVVAVGLSVQPAHAGTMVVYSCHTPSGRTVGTDGWTLSADNAVPRAGVRDSCADGPTGALRLEIERDGAHVDGSQELSWTFRSADATTISEFKAWVCGRAFSFWALARFRWQAPVGEPKSMIVYKSPDGAPDTMGCQGSRPWWSSSANLVRASEFASSWLEMTAGCGGICDVEPKVAATMELGAFAASISDASPPTAVAPTGPVVSDQVHTGVETIRFSVTDKGVGVFRLLGEVRPHHEGPWLQFAESILGGSSCRPLGETGYLYEFSSPQPCPTAVGDASLSMDNTRLGVGSHDFRVVAEDAAGNRTLVWQSDAYEIGTNAEGTARANPRPAQLKITAPGTRRQRSAKAFQLRGSLVDADSNAIGGALVVVESRGYLPKSNAPFGGWETVGTAVTDARGAYRLQVPRGPSRTLRVSYTAPSSEGASAVALVDVVVPAQITARARHARVRNGKSVVFDGRVAGPIPQGGLLVSLEAREPGRWVPVATTRRRVRTSRSGRFSLRYRFRRTFSATTYRFRVVADEDSAFPYARGASRSLTVRVRP